MGLLGGNRAAAVGTAAVGTAATACAEIRSAYHDCFNRWYAEKFSKGQWQKEECVDQWNKYRACLEEHLEDKHIRKMLLESDTKDFLDLEETASSQKQ